MGGSDYIGVHNLLPMVEIGLNGLPNFFWGDVNPLPLCPPVPTSLKESLSCSLPNSSCFKANDLTPPPILFFFPCVTKVSSHFLQRFRFRNKIFENPMMRQEMKIIKGTEIRFCCFLRSFLLNITYCKRQKHQFQFIL